MEREGASIEKFATRKTAALLVLLAVESNQPHDRLRLAQRLWGAETPTTTRQNLRKALSFLTAALGSELFDVDARTVRLRPGAFTTDLAALEAARRRARGASLTPMERCTRWEEALALDSGELVPELTDSALLPHQQRHQKERQKTLETLVTLCQERGDSEGERRWRERLSGDAQPSNLPSTSNDLAVTVPHPLRSLVGRRDDEAALVRLLLEGSARLITVTGPGGMGKTHLALETAQKVEAAFARIAWCPLAEQSVPETTLSAAARALGIRVHDGEALLAALTKQLTVSTLLIMDNAEHLLPGIATPLAALLESSVHLSCLVTSRLPLGLVGEQEFPLEALSPESAALLLQQRIEGVRPQHIWDTAEREALQSVCARLDGIPLAIELAASRTRTRSVAALARMLETEGIDGLRTAEQGRPERHRTLRTAIVGSLAQLPPEMSTRFDALGVFAGPFPTVAAAALWSVSEGEASDCLDELVRQGVAVLLPPLVFEAEGRFRLLEPIREVAREHLLVSVEIETQIRRRHADYYLALVGQIERARRGTTDEAPYLWLEAETPNLHAAFHFSLTDTPARVAAAIQASRTLAWPWLMRGFGAEVASHRYTERFLAREADLDERDLWLVQLIQGQLALRERDFTKSEVSFRKAICLLESRPDFVSPEPWLALGEVRVERGFLEEGYALIEEAAAHALAAGEREQAAWALAELASLLRERKDWERWHPVAVKARALENEARGLPLDAPHMAWDCDLARLEAHKGCWAEAERQMRSVVKSYQEAGWKVWAAGALYEQAFFLERQGYASEAEPLYQKSITLFETLGELGQLAEVRRRVAGYQQATVYLT